MRARAFEALERGSDVVELRLDALRGSTGEISGLADGLPSGRWIATCRPVSAGGMFQGPIERRVERLLAAGSAGEGFIDFEFANWRGTGASSNARHDILRQSMATGAGGHPPSLILSHHTFEQRPADLERLVTEMCAVGEAAAIKLAWPAENILSNFDAFEIMRSAPKEVIAICMGEAGLPSRVLAGKFGAFATYCADGPGSETAPGQLTLDEMLDQYRCHAIDESTEVYGVIGCPVAHSIGPALFNDAFAAGRVHGVYLPLLVEATYEDFAAFVDACLEYDWLDARGFSVTLPHKVHAFKYLGDRVDPPAETIGAVNTLRIEDGEIWGCNTDCQAALETLVHGMGCTAEELEGVAVDVLGAGGVARAVVAGLIDCGCRVTVYNRDPERARSLADAVGCGVRPWEERVTAEGKILINCTSVGMWPVGEASPMPLEGLDADTVVFDTVYRPRRTRLLTDAQSVGCRTIGGAGMFVSQAAMQFEYWTQQAADYARMAAIVEQALATEMTA